MAKVKQLPAAYVDSSVKVFVRNEVRTTSNECKGWRLSWRFGNESFFLDDRT
jgi:hypothetical protein